MNNKPFSVLITVKNRADHLVNVVTAIEHSSVVPQDVVIVHMNEPATVLPSTLNLTQVTLQTAEPLPLAAARNHAASPAATENLIFLDVDCIPDRTCFETLLNEGCSNAIVMVNPLYLTRSVERIDFAALRADAQPNPARQGLDLGLSDSYEQFWSLGFFVTRDLFGVIGGFDESFKGYGAEDTDFAFTARSKAVRLFFSDATVFHQPHPEYDPPLNWLRDIVANAVTFHVKWGRWPMEGWLHGFEERGYIKRGTDGIDIIRLPTEAEITRARR